MLNLIKRNKTYLFATFLMIFYPMILILVVIMLFDPTERAFALDKLTHFGTFSILSYIIYFALSYQEKVWFLKKNRESFTVIIALLIGASIEIIQLFLPKRSTNLLDMIANLSGIIFTLLIIKYLPKRIKKLKRIGI